MDTMRFGYPFVRPPQVRSYTQHDNLRGTERRAEDLSLARTGGRRILAQIRDIRKVDSKSPSLWECLRHIHAALYNKLIAVSLFITYTVLGRELGETDMRRGTRPHVPYIVMTVAYSSGLEKEGTRHDRSARKRFAVRCMSHTNVRGMMIVLQLAARFRFSLAFGHSAYRARKHCRC